MERIPARRVFTEGGVALSPANKPLHQPKPHGVHLSREAQRCSRHRCIIEHRLAASQVNGKPFGRLAGVRKRRYDPGVMVDDRDERDPDEDDRRSRSVPKELADGRGWKKWLRIPIAIFILVGGFASIWSLYLEVRAGRGGELRRSMLGFKVSPIGILVAVGSSVVALFGIWAVEWWLHRRDRAWKPRHPRKPT